jgi:rhodanese-related sulfurtransferase
MKHKYLPFFLTFLTVVFMSCGHDRPQAQQTPAVRDIAVADVCEQVNENQDVLLLDVRTEEEYTGELGHLKNSRLIPVGELESRLSEINDYKTKEIIVYCRSGGRSSRAGKLLVSQGFTNVSNMLGGMRGWNSASASDLPCKDMLLEN